MDNRRGARRIEKKAASIKTDGGVGKRKTHRTGESAQMENDTRDVLSAKKAPFCILETELTISLPAKRLWHLAVKCHQYKPVIMARESFLAASEHRDRPLQTLIP